MMSSQAGLVNLLVATDLSPRGDRALARAVQMASATGGELTVLHVVDEELPAPMARSLREQASDLLSRQMSELTAGRPLRFTVAVELGMDFEVITHKARNAEVVILGAHREQWLKDVFVGTTAERVLRHGMTPTLVVKGPVAGPYRNILVAVDLSETSRKALLFARRLWPAVPATVLYVIDAPFLDQARVVAIRPEAADDNAKAVLDEGRANLSAFLAEAGVEGVEPVVILGEAPVAIEREAAARSSDLVVLGTHGRSGIAHVMLGSVAERQLRHLPRDVLAVKPGQEFPHQ